MADPPARKPAKKAAAKKAPAKKAPAKKAEPEKVDPVAPPYGRAPVDNVRQIRAGSGRGNGSRGRRVSKTTPRAIAITMRRQKAVALRNSGVSFNQIADMLRPDLEGLAYTGAEAYKDVKAALADIIVPTIEDYRADGVSRCDWALRAIAADIQRGDLDAINTMLKIEGHRAKLLGTYASTSVRVTGPDGGPIMFAPVIDRDQAIADALEAVNEVLGDTGTP